MPYAELAIQMFVHTMVLQPLGVCAAPTSSSSSSKVRRNPVKTQHVTVFCFFLSIKLGRAPKKFPRTVLLNINLVII